MKERICREGDESVYQPKIHSDRIKELYKIGLETGLPMTVLVDYAIRSYVKVYYEEKKREQEALNEYEFRCESIVQEERDKHKYEETDQWEDGSLYGF